MMEREFQPIEENAQWSREVAEQIRAALFDTIYLPLLQIAAGEVKERENSKADLKRALRSGRVQWKDGRFTGTFSGIISKAIRALGGEWDTKRKNFTLDWARVPEDVRVAAAEGQSAIIGMRSKLEAKIADLNQSREKVLGFIDIGTVFEKVTRTLNKEFKRTLAPALDVPVEMTPFIEDELRENYINNIDTYISKWSEEAVERLRERMQEEVTAGFRADHMMKVIQAEAGVSANKAKFLARQETSLMVSNYREARYKEAGLERYRWSTSHDTRVRPRHKELSGHVFDWSNPPVVDEVTGRKAHPGEDFGCRCVAIPILRMRG